MLPPNDIHITSNDMHLTPNEMNLTQTPHGTKVAPPIMTRICHGFPHGLTLMFQDTIPTHNGAITIHLPVTKLTGNH